MAAAPYYGNIETLRLLLTHMRDLQDEEYHELVYQYDDLVRPLLEADLHGMFRSWYPPDDTNSSIISVLWLYQMAHQITSNHFAANNLGVPSSYGGELAQKYNELLRDVKAGRLVVLGASRHSAYPTGRAHTSQRITINPGPDTPQLIEELLQHGLRR